MDIKKLKEGYESPFISVRELAEELGVRKDEVIKKAKELGLVNVRKTNLTPEQYKAIQEWNGKESITKLAERIGLSMEAVRKRLKEFGKDTTAYMQSNPVHLHKKIEQNEEFLEDLANPRYSSADLAEKYGVTDRAIQGHRQRKFGKFKPQLDTSSRMTTIEKKVQAILDDLDLAYFVHKVVHGWNLDFYLGQKKAIEVNGNFWHDSERVKEKDNRKLTQLKELGYDVLVIEQDELNDMSKVKSKIQEFWVSLASNSK